MKKNVQLDITKTVISAIEMRGLVVMIFPDSIVLDSNFQIFSACENLSKALGYSSHELQNTSFQAILSDLKELESIKSRLASGYFDKYPIRLKYKNGTDLLFVVSGFYLGLISDINDLIVLKLQNMEELKHVKNQLEAKVIEMDDFIYHSAHSLRGPLATLKGLIGLSRLTTDKSDLDVLTFKMEQFAESLDDKLSTLLKFAGFENGDESLSSSFTFEKLGNSLHNVMEYKLNESNVVLKNAFLLPEARIDKGRHILEILTHLVTFFLKQNKKKGSEIVVEGSLNKAFFELRLRTSGISVQDEHKGKLENANFGYVEILNDTQFAGLYSAKKFLQKINGRIKITFPNENEVFVQLKIPKTLYNPSMIDPSDSKYFYVLK